jgi:YHS domain-containing protein
MDTPSFREHLAGMDLDDGRVVLGDAQQEVDAQVTDPVCGMELQRTDAVAATDHQGTIYYFCSAPCKQRFVEAPQRFVSPAASP